MSTFFSHVTVKPQKSIQESIVVENSTLKLPKSVQESIMVENNSMEPPKSIQESIVVENNAVYNFDQFNDSDRIFVINAISRLRNEMK